MINSPVMIDSRLRSNEYIFRTETEEIYCNNAQWISNCLKKYLLNMILKL